MADNLSVTEGAGRVVAADDVGGVLMQRIKPQFGADGAAADWDGTQHIGEVGGKTTLTAITFSLNTSIYADGDVLADTQVLTACLRVADGTGILQDVIFNDEDDTGQPFDVLILQANTSIGTENAAPSITDANARNIIGRFQVLSGDWYDLGGVKIASIKNIGIGVKAAAGTTNLYVALISRGAGTYTASGITAVFKILCD